MSRLKRSDLLAGTALAVLALLIGLAIVFGGRAPSDRAGGDRGGGPCDPGVELQLCEEALVEVQSTLKNAATAEESFAVSHDGRYTGRLPALEREGLRLPPRVDLSITLIGRDGYCLEATSRGLVGSMYYSSTEGAPLPGAC